MKRCIPAFLRLETPPLDSAKKIVTNLRVELQVELQYYRGATVNSVSSSQTPS